MRCNRVDDLLPAYLDGDLPDSLNRQVSAHLDGCGRCRRSLSDQQQAFRLLDAGRQPIAIDLWADFSRRLQQQAPRRSPWRYLWQPGLAVGLAAVVVALVARMAPSVPAPTAPALERPVARAPAPMAPGPPGRGSPTKLALAATDPEPETSKQPSSHSSSPEARSRSEERVSRPAEAPRSRNHRGRDLMAAGPSSRPRAESVRLKPARLPHRLMRVARLPVRVTEGEDVTPAVTRPERPVVADPTSVAEALVAAPQDAASDQVHRELLLLAGQMARMGGEAASTSDANRPTGT
jgi:hypothetical protein